MDHLDREPTALEREKALHFEKLAEAQALERQLITEAHAERQAVGERARSTIERQEGESARRHDLEDREREMGIRCR